MSLPSLLLFLGCSILPSLVITWLATFVVRRLAPKYGLLDQPNQRKVHVTPTPLGGGLAISFGVILPFLLGSLVVILVDESVIARFVPALVMENLGGLLDRLGNLWVILVGAAILMVVGLVDDRRGLDWRLRLAVQFVVASVCVATQGWELTAFIDFGPVGWFGSVGLSVIWIVALINSFNMLDNMDGLSAGVAAIAATVLAAIMLISARRPPAAAVCRRVLVRFGRCVARLPVPQPSTRPDLYGRRRQLCRRFLDWRGHVDCDLHRLPRGCAGSA